MTAFGFPLDWQFWVVTGAAVGAAALLVRPYVVSWRRKTGAGCITCASGADACRSASPEPPEGKLVTLGGSRRPAR